MGKALQYFSFSFFVLFIVLPLLFTFFSVFFDNELIANIQQIDSESFVLLLKSILLAFATALFSTFFGTLLAFLLYKTNIPCRNFLKTILLIPLFISPYILAVAWRDFFYLFTNNTGFINSYTGVLWILTSIFTPLSILITGSALTNIDTQLEESALIITTLRNTVLKIHLPLIKPAIISSFILVFIFSISEFSVPAYLGVKVFTTEIFTQFSAFYNHSLAIMQSLILVVLCIFLLLSEKKYIAEAPFLSVSSKGNRSKLLGKEKNNTGLLFVVFWLILSVILPFLVLFFQAFANGTEYFVQAFYLLLPTFANSIKLAMAGAFFTVFIGFTRAYFSVNQNNTIPNRLFAWLLLIVFAIPSIIFGISLIKFYNRPGIDFIYSSAIIIVIAYTGKFAFISAKIIENALRQIPKSLDEIAQIEGINFYRRLSKIILPLIMPALFSAFIISFIFNLGELGISIMLYPPGTEIMPIKVYTIMANAPQSLTSSMTLIVFSISLLIIGGFYLLYVQFENKFTKQKII